MLEFDDEGNLLISDRLAEAIIFEDFWEFDHVLGEGSSEKLSYQDIHEYQLFKANFTVLGRFPVKQINDFYRGMEFITVVRHASGATYGFEWWYEGGKYGEPHYSSDYYDEESDQGIYKFIPVEPLATVSYRRAGENHGD